jgi:hypothetical protein
MREPKAWLSLVLLVACVPSRPTAPVELAVSAPQPDTAVARRGLAEPRRVDSLLIRLTGMDQSTRAEDRARWIRPQVVDGLHPSAWVWIRPLEAKQFIEVRPQPPDWLPPLALDE